MITTAAIVAAGLGSRLNELTEMRPKGFLELAGRSLVDRSLDALASFGIERVVIGTGYLAEHYEALAERRADLEIVCVRSDRYENTSSMYTLARLQDAIGEVPFLLLESDLLYEPRALAELLEDPREDVVLASGPTRSGDEVYIETTDDALLVGMSKDRTKLGRVDAELVGITKISPPAYRAMCEVMAAQLETWPKMDYESALVAITGDRDVHVKRIDGLVWCEIDDHQHLRRALDEILPRVEAGYSQRQPGATWQSRRAV